MEVGIVIPAYNAESNIKNVLLKIFKYVKPDNIFVIDDGSADRTSEIADELNVKCIRHNTNLGKGEALKTGFSAAGKTGVDAVITIDSDGQHDPDKIPEFIRIMEHNNSDIVLGTRSFGLSNMPIDRILSNRLSSLVVSLVCGKWIPDSQCGYRMIRLKSLDALSLTSSNFELESELLIKAARQKRNITFCPVPVIYNGTGSKINRLKDTKRFCKMIIGIIGKR
ncbi:glycosyltransferase family 2 protein [bacterium]|nr:glycosyltransferase family 2 protein [bacterium]